MYNRRSRRPTPAAAPPRTRIKNLLGIIVSFGVGATPEAARASRSLAPLLVGSLLVVAGCPAAPPQQVPPTEEIYQPGPAITEGRSRPPVVVPPPSRDAGSRLAGGDDAGPASARLGPGQPCFDGGECESGICEGEGCGTNQPGVCIGPGRACQGPEETFCGCDGEIFRAPRDCPGQPFAKRGKCRAR